MKIYYTTLLFVLLSIGASAQDIFGKWMVSEEDGTEKSIVEIYEENDKVYGKIIDIIKTSNKGATCDKCTGEDVNKPLLGMVIIKGLSKGGVYHRNGNIIDPDNGKSFKCRLSLEKETPNVLEVRSYVAFTYETQFWKRVK